jgi:hypothetical protein
MLLPTGAAVKPRRFRTKNAFSANRREWLSAAVQLGEGAVREAAYLRARREQLVGYSVKTALPRLFVVYRCYFGF